jgi:hypothetical protein
MNNNDELANTPIAHYHRPDGITCSLVETSPRAAAWLHVFHRLDGIPVTSLYAEKMEQPDHSTARVHMLDLSRITGAERARLIVHIAQKSGAPAHIVDQELDIAGCSILATDVTVSIPI